MPFNRRQFLQLGSAAGLAWVATPGALSRSLTRVAAAGPAADPLAAGFDVVPHVVKPGCYWWWFDGHVDRAGITRDLEQYRAKGIGEVLLVNSSNFGPPDTGPNPAPFLSPAWRELYRHAIREAARLGIDVGVNLSGGWCMGGPWITPRDSGRWFLQSRLTIEGPRRLDGPLPLPGHRDGYDHVFNPPGYKQYIDLPLSQLDYRDTAVVAFPDPGLPGEKVAGQRAKLLAAKTNRRDASNFMHASAVMGPPGTPWHNEPGDRPIAIDQVIDLTSRLTPDGRLDWDVPPGRWTIVRTGHRMTGSRLSIPPPEAAGLSVDWLASHPVDLQFEHLGRLFLDEAARAGGRLAYFCDDSFEDGFPNWTEKIVSQFQHYRGYDPRPFLPVLAGYLVGSAEISDRFLHDYRKTVADLMADRHYGRFAELCHEHGLQVQNEAAGPSRSGTMCMDGLKNLGRSDRPMGEFWLGLHHDERGGLDPKLPYGNSRLENSQNKVTKMVSSAAHTYGRPTASAESFTSNRHWIDSPATLKPAADRAFCEGINRLIIHESTATRAAEGLPGYEYYAGTHFSVNAPWWGYVGPFLEYLGRCQHLLRAGKFVADVLFYVGDRAPSVAVPKHVDPSLGPGFDYDVCNTEVLLTRLAVRAGRIVLPDGMNYRLLALPDDQRLPAEVVGKLRDLVHAGATIVGPKPARDPGLRNYPSCDYEIDQLAAEVWGPCDGRVVTSHTYGRGRVFWGVPLRTVLAHDGIGPDFEPAAAPGVWIDFLHRSRSDAEIYFVANRNWDAAALDVAFRVTGRVPEIWDPVTGERRAAVSWRVRGRQTVVPLAFASHQAYFVVFRRTGTAVRTPPAAAAGGALSPWRNFPHTESFHALTGPWTVHFDPKWGAPTSVEFARLEDWIERPEDSIRHYAGTATYAKRFDLAAVPAGAVFLDLGVVKEIASVRLNGRDLGVVWTAPWRIEVTGALRPGANDLEIRVANVWHNRVVGDAALPPDQRLSRTNVPVNPKSPLRSAGLLGPVTLARPA